MGPTEDLINQTLPWAFQRHHEYGVVMAAQTPWFQIELDLGPNLENSPIKTPLRDPLLPPGLGTPHPRVLRSQ